MNTKDKLQLIRLGAQERQLTGCVDLLGDSGRAIKAEVYADVLRRHPNALNGGRFGRVVKAVNNIIANR